MFNYGNVCEGDPNFKVCLEKEFFERSQYEKYVKVKEGDIVVDIGASIGPFLYTIRDRGVKKVIAVEPLTVYQDLLKENSQGLPLKIIKKAISAESSGNYKKNLKWSCYEEEVDTISFKNIIKYLPHIDFLKLDCEGGEYNIFTRKYIDYLKKYVRYIVGEFHLGNKKNINNFKRVYNLLKSENFNFKIESVSGLDIFQQSIDDLDAFCNHYEQLIIYIDNRKIEKKKLLYIAPHLSTGGLPQYLVKKIELLKDEFEIYLVEWSDITGGQLVIQRNKILDLVDSNKFFTLGDDKSNLLQIINKIQPNIIHLEEIPEFFMDNEIANKIYSPNRKYFIIETSHDSSYDTSRKRFFPDKFMFVSNWQIEQYKNIDIPKVLVEYPIEIFERPNREGTLEMLGLDPKKKHILHVGLFTPRKNQAEFFEYARALPKYEFHCLGNHADNFKHYWEPLMENKPNNLTWWNERTDVENFYGSMDLFLFTSRGSDKDKETMPLVIKEAISYQIPTLIYNLPVYQDYFDKFPGVDYLEFDEFEVNCNHIKSELNGTTFFKPSPKNEIFIISTYPNTKSITQTTKECIKSVQKTGRKVILTSHIPIPKELQEISDYCIFDKNNILTKHTYYNQFHEENKQYKVKIDLREENNDIYHGPAVYTNYYNGIILADKLGYDKVYCMNFDYILRDSKYIDYISTHPKAPYYFFGEYEALEGPTLYTYFFAGNPDYLLHALPQIKNVNDYEELVKKYKSESNGLENLFYNILVDKKHVYCEPREKFESDTKKYFDHKDYSQVEYFTILPTDISNEFVPFFYISNAKDSRKIYYNIYKNEKLIKTDEFEINQKLTFWDLLEYKKGDIFDIYFDINYDEYNFRQKHFRIDANYMKNKLKNNGLFNLKY